MTSEKIFTYDCSAHGAAGYGIEIYPETRINDSTCYVINFVRDGIVYECDCEDVGQMLRICIDRFVSWCPEADAYDIALFVEVMAEKIRAYAADEHDVQFA